MPLHLILQAVHLMMSSKKGISSHQLSRVLEVQYNTAWFLSHRIREEMRSGDLAPFGSGGGVVEVDENFIGKIGRTHVCTPLTHAHLVCRILMEKQKR